MLDNDLFIKPEKYHFDVNKVEFLGVFISKDSICIDSEKVKDVQDWPEPRKVKEVQAFLGLANFYRRFIKDFSRMAKPLHQKKTHMSMDIYGAYIDKIDL